MKFLRYTKCVSSLWQIQVGTVTEKARLHFYWDSTGGVLPSLLHTSDELNFFLS